VRELDRLSRNLAKQLIVEEELKRAGVRVEYVLVEYDDTPEGRLQKHLSLFFALFQLKRETKSSRLAMARGIKLGQQEKKRISELINRASACRLVQQAH